MVNLTTVSEALKVLYINPIREFVNMRADPFAARILQTSDNITGYQKIVRAVQIGANGGAGAGTEHLKGEGHGRKAKMLLLMRGKRVG